MLAIDPKRFLDQYGVDGLRLRIAGERSQRDLLEFIKQFWRVNDRNTPLVMGWPLEAICDHLMAVTDGHIKRLLINIPPGSMKSLAAAVFWPAWEWGPMGRPWYRYICASYNQHLTKRDNRRFLRVIQDPDYYRLWGTQFVMEQTGQIQIINNRTGWKLATSVEGVGTGERGNRIIIDDANNPKDVESDVVREGVQFWIKEVMPDRLNSLEDDVIVCIQQRTHEHDATGTLLELAGLDYVHLCIPAEYDSGRHCITVLKRDEEGAPERTWEDPRGLEENGERLEGHVIKWQERAIGPTPVCIGVVPGSPAQQADGELYWPNRISREKLREMQIAKGPIAYCTPAETPILMGDLSLRPIASLREGDIVVGFTTAPGAGGKRRRLVKARIGAISVSKREVVRITLSSGKVIRCTPDHRWLTAKGLHEGYLYSKPRRGAALVRVCPPCMEPLLGADMRLGGWLGGFFDGEGSVIFRQKSVNGKAASLITFTQGNGRNLPLCEKLERVLDHFGFTYGMNEHERSDRMGQGDSLQRTYYLTGRPRLPIYQKFLHVADPAKWRDRIIDGALSSRFRSNATVPERIVSIEPDGIETVYGLTTETGNYVAWGLASSNSGQYQQAPSPRGGGIIRREWWKLWEKPEFPDFIMVAGSLDTAFKEKEEADYNALTIWGIFLGEQGEPLVMLINAWRDRTDLATLAEKVGNMLIKHKADYLLIEDKARGHDTAGELRRQFGTRRWSTRLLDPHKLGGDKVARLTACQPMFSGDAVEQRGPDGKPNGTTVWLGGLVWAPDKQYAEDVMGEVERFPKGAHDDFVDTVSMFFQWARKYGEVRRLVEHLEQQNASNQYRKRSTVLYDV